MPTHWIQHTVRVIGPRDRRRWIALGAVFVATWLASGAGVPVYDGIGNPDEPYRHFPPREGAMTPAATVANGRLVTAGGLTVRGVYINSAEVGPQVSLFIPPYSLEVPSATRPAAVDVVARPVAPTGTRVPGLTVSNVYEVSFKSAVGRVSVRAPAQAPGITMRSVDAEQPTPTVRYRPTPDAPWSPLTTKRLGFDIYHSDMPGAGSYVLSRDAPVQAARKPSPGSSRSWLIVVGLVLIAPLLAVVRLLTRRSGQQS